MKNSRKLDPVDIQKLYLDGATLPVARGNEPQQKLVAYGPSIKHVLKAKAKKAATKEVVKSVAKPESMLQFLIRQPAIDRLSAIKSGKLNAAEAKAIRASLGV
jgi:hypothetical protein